VERKKILVIGDKYTVRMFNLIGIEGVVIEKPDQDVIRKTLDNYINSGDIGIIYITKDLADYAQDYISHISLTRRTPIITVIPSRWSRIEEIDVSSLLRKALGVG